MPQRPVAKSKNGEGESANDRFLKAIRKIYYMRLLFRGLKDKMIKKRDHIKASQKEYYLQFSPYMVSAIRKKVVKQLIKKVSFSINLMFLAD